ncbi:hypothetical protein D9M68_880090 [compost metagenome]
MLAQASRAWQLADHIVVIDEGIEQLGAGGLGALLAVVVVDVLEQSAFVLQLEVVPVLPAKKHAGIAVLQLQVVDALEYLREGLAALEVQTTIIAGLGEAGSTVGGTDQVLVDLAGAPAGADRQRGVELPLDLTDLE